VVVCVSCLGFRIDRKHAEILCETMSVQMGHGGGVFVLVFDLKKSYNNGQGTRNLRQGERTAGETIREFSSRILHQ